MHGPCLRCHHGVPARQYKEACDKKDQQLLPSPYGLKGQVPMTVQLQMIILKDQDGNHAITKHLAFPSVELCIAPMSNSPKVGRSCNTASKGLAVGTSNAISSPGSPNEEREDEETDAGFDFILKHGPQSSFEMAQLRWQTKAIRKETCPIFGWPTGLVGKSLTNFSSDAALARREFCWPIPLTLKYYAPWLLKSLETIWNFDRKLTKTMVTLNQSWWATVHIAAKSLQYEQNDNQWTRNAQIQKCAQTLLYRWITMPTCRDEPCTPKALLRK